MRYPTHAGCHCDSNTAARSSVALAASSATSGPSYPLHAPTPGSLLSAIATAGIASPNASSPLLPPSTPNFSSARRHASVGVLPRVETPSPVTTNTGSAPSPASMEQVSSIDPSIT